MGAMGDAAISTTSGRITLGTTGDTEISTKSGSVDAGSVGGAFQVRSVSGTVTVGVVGEGAGQSQHGLRTRSRSDFPLASAPPCGPLVVAR